jgi:SAGA-associated factor 29
LKNLVQQCKDFTIMPSCSASNALIGLLDGLLQSGASTAQKKKIGEYWNLEPRFCKIGSCVLTRSMQYSTVVAFYISEVGEQKKKRIKSDTDSARFSAASMRNQLDQAASLKGEQVQLQIYLITSISFYISCFHQCMLY